MWTSQESLKEKVFRCLSLSHIPHTSNHFFLLNSNLSLTLSICSMCTCLCLYLFLHVSIIIVELTSCCWVVLCLLTWLIIILSKNIFNLYLWDTMKLL
jgi:hypothetical protein